MIRHNLFIPGLVFLLLMSMSLFSWYYTLTAIDQDTEKRFATEAAHLQEQILNRFYTYEQVLKGGVGLFRVSPHVSREEWRTYVESLKLAEHFPGIQGIGFSEWIGDESGLARHEERMQAEGFDSYAVKPPGQRGNYTSVTYLEPFDERNRQAIGYDMFSQETRREAMERARDTGEPALSGKVELVQEITTEKQAGFLLYLPLYSTKTIPPTKAGRQEALTGFIYSPFRAADLMKGVLQERFAKISFRIFDGSQVKPDSILFDGESDTDLKAGSKQPRYVLTEIVFIAGRPWTVKYAATPSFRSVDNSLYPRVLLLAGIVFSFLMAVIMWRLVTVRRQIETRTTELYQQEALNSALLENLEEAAVACDANMNLTLFNKKAREWHGGDLRREPAERWPALFDLFEADGKTPLVSERIPLVRAFRGERMSSQGMSICLPGLSPRYVLASGNAMVDSEGRTTGAVVLMRDITESKQAAERTQQQQEFLRQVIDNSPYYISALDTQGRYVLVNNKFSADYFGLTPDQLTGRTHAQLVGEREKGRLAESTITDDLTVIGTGESVSKIEKFSDMNGSMHWLHTEKVPVTAPGSSDILALTVASDITEQKISQEHIIKLNEVLEDRVKQRTERLEQTNQELIIAKEAADGANLAKSSFLAAMSHEIRTPMNGVVGMVDILMNEPLTRDQLDSVRTIRDSAFSLLSIIDDLLDFSKIEAEHIELERMPVSVSDITENVVSSLVQVALRAQVHLSLFIDPQIPSLLTGDATRLRQIVTNLVGNAIKFSGGSKDRQGKVSLRITTEQTDPFVLRCNVTDNGIGMTPETVHQVFSPFVQADASTTRHFGGTGLGLSICKRLVELMQGEIRVTSAEGLGSTFSVILPLPLASGDSEHRYEDITGVHCIILPSEHYRADDLTAYIQAARAVVFQEKDRLSAARKAASLEAPVVVLQSQAHVSQQDKIDVFDAELDVRHVMLTRGLGNRVVNVQPNSGMAGRRTRPGTGSFNTVKIDVDGLRRSALIEAIAVAAGRASPEVVQIISRDNEIERVEPLSEKDAVTAGTLILVVEDDVINTIVIKRQLSMLGFTAEFAENGLVALTMWRNKKYGMLLTDLHMPRMDGYELVRRIRQEENQAKKIPIIALTANALQGEGSRVKALGVDEYLTKPIELRILKDALEKFLKPAESICQKQDKMQTAGSPDISLADNEVQIFDRSVLPQIIGDDEDVISDFLMSFLHSANDVAASLLGAAEKKDWQTAGQFAHRLKSSSLSIGAMQLGELCKKIEYACTAKEHELAKNYQLKLMKLFRLTRTEITSCLEKNQIQG